MVSLKSIPASFGLIVAVLLGCAAGWFFKPGATSAYLELQAISDTVHRFTLLALPLAIVFAIISGILAHRLRNRFRNILVGISAVSLGLGSGILTYTLLLDTRLEERGLVGQFESPDASELPIETVRVKVLGPFSEEPEGPQAAKPHAVHQALPNGDVVTLDRQGLARTTANGNVRWNLPRPSQRPSSLLIIGDSLFWLCGGDYEDDTLLLVIALNSGRVRWSYHCLGNRAFPPAVEGFDLAFATWRPATSSVVLMWWIEPRLTWAIRIDTPLVLPPRFMLSGIEVATRDEVLLLARDTGQVLKREPACEHPEAVGVACQAGQVVAWMPKETP